MGDLRGRVHKRGDTAAWSQSGGPADGLLLSVPPANGWIATAGRIDAGLMG